MANSTELKNKRRDRVRRRLRSRNTGRPRLSIFRSGKNIYAQSGPDVGRGLKHRKGPEGEFEDRR